MDTSSAPQTLLDAAAAWQLRLHDGGAEVDEAFARWLDAAPEHRLAYADVCMAGFALEQMVEDVAVAAAPVPVAEARSQARTPGHSSRRRGRRWIARGIAVAASLAVLVGGVSTAWLQQTRWQDWRSDASTGTAQVRQVSLDDGSDLWLAPDSAVDIRIDASTRRIDVHRGEVFAQVARDPTRPFEIVAGDIVARAIGTRYSVARAVDGVDVAVQEGRVSVRGHMAASIELVAGQAVHAADGVAPFDPVAAPPGRFAWRDGLLVLEDAPLGEALARLDAYLPQRIVWAPRRADDPRRITAAIPAGDAAAALDAIVAEHGLTRHDLAGVVTVIR